MNIAEIRQKYPQYDNISDEQLARGLHKKYYPTLDFDDFAQRIGYQAQNPVLKMTPEQKEQAAKAAKEWREQVKPTTAGDKVANWMVTDPLGRGIGFIVQGTANAGLNPFGHAMRSAGVDTKPLGEPQTAGERISEKTGEYATNTALFYETLKNAAAAGIGGNGLWGNIIKSMSEGGAPLNGASALGSAIATGAINPKTWWGQLLTDMGGGVWGGGAFTKLTTPKFNIDKSAQNAINRLQKIVDKNSLNEAMTEAERTGRSALEVGDDSILQAAQSARQQTPEARQILTKYMNNALEAQKARTRGVIDEQLGTQGKSSTIADVARRAQQQSQPMYNELENIGNLETYEIKQNLNKIRPERYRDFEAKTGLTPDQYEQIVTEQAQQIKTPIFQGVENSTVANKGNKHLYLTEQNTISQKAPFVHTLSDTMNNPDMTFSKPQTPLHNASDYIVSMQKNMPKPDKYGADVVILQDGSVYNKMPVNKNYLANQLGQPIDNLSINGNLLNDMGISPSLEGNYNISRLGTLVKENDVIADTIARVKRSNSSLKKLPDTDFRVINEARKALSQAGMNKTELSGYEARQALKELDPILDDIVPKYAEARKIYENTHKFEEAAEMGRDVFNNRVSIDEFMQKMSKLTQNEKKAVSIGMRDELTNRLGAAYNENVANKKFLTDNVKQKVVAAVGEKRGNMIIDEAEQAYKLNQNANKLFSGSQTAEKTGLRDKLQGFRRFVRNPWDTTVDAVSAPFDNKRNVQIAGSLINRDLPSIYNQMRLHQYITNALQKPKINWSPYLIAVEQLEK